MVVLTVLEVKKWLDSEYTVEEGPTVFAEIRYAACGKEAKDDPFLLRLFFMLTLKKMF